MTNFTTDIAIIGAGVIGLATGRNLALKKKEILILEELEGLGQITSSRNSGVIHAGIYYQQNSLKAKMCLKGNRLLYEYCEKHSIPHRNTKKILVATNHDQVQIIDKIKLQAEKNGVENIEKLSNLRVSKIEPLIKCKEGLLVPTSGILDSISFMNSLEWEIKEAGGIISYNSKISKINFDGQFFRLEVLDKKSNIIIIKCKTLINTAGLYASDVANKIQEIDKKFIPITYFAKGNYFSLGKDLGIRHLIYPVPEGFGLGIHLTLELDNTIKFGPDVEWVRNTNNYDVNIERKDIFIEEIKKYLPSLDVNLLQPSYSGIRSIMNKKDKSMRDFIIHSSNEHQIPGLLNLYGIESPGLTCSLALAEHLNEFFIT